MDINKFSWRIMELMSLIMKGAVHQEHNYLTQGKITIPQFWVLEYLSRQGVSRMSDIAAFLNVTKPAATGIIDRLLNQQLVSRTDDTEDRRVIWIAINAKGKTIVEHIKEQKNRTLVHIFSKISPTERSQYLHILEEIAKIVNTDVVKTFEE
jgi:DNA-binding MarR family transcriptional regulator